MQLCRIGIERFNGIKKLDISLENSLQLIAGPNNSCKSTILKAIHYFFTCFENIPISDYEPQNDYYKLETRSTTKIKLHFNNLNEAEMGVFRKNWLVRNKEIWIELRLDRKGDISLFSSGNDNPKAAYDALVDSYQVIYVPAVRAGTNDLRAIETRKLFVTARSVLSRKKRGKLSLLQKSFADATKQVTDIMQSLLEESLAHVKESLPSEAEIKFKFPDSDEALDLLLSRTTISTRTGTNLTVDDEGTGFQSLLSLGLLKYIQSIGSGQNLLFLVEEPEAFLHPQYQRAVSDYLMHLAKKSQVLISTHSSILVDSVELSHITRLIKNHNGLEYRWKWEQSDLERLKYLSRYCDAKNSELIFSEKVILCEGTTDKSVICEIYRQANNSEHHIANISVISGDGSAIAHVAHIMNLFKIESIIVMDKDNYSGDRVCLKKICEEKGLPLANADYKVLDDAKSTKCSSYADAVAVRDKVNQILKSRNIFLLGGDIESAVVHSYSKAKILEHLGPDGLGHIKQEVMSELTGIGGERFINRVNQLIGSKGWGTNRPIKENKPKPHVLQNFIASAGIRSFRANSDMAALSEAISLFLSR